MHMLHVSALYTYVELHRSLLIFPFLSLYAVYNYTSSLLSRAWRACRGILSHLCLPLTVMSYPSHSYVMPSHSSVLWLFFFFFLKTAGSMQGVGLDEKQKKKKCRLMQHIHACIQYRGVSKKKEPPQFSMLSELQFLSSKT